MGSGLPGDVIRKVRKSSARADQSFHCSCLRVTPIPISRIWTPA